MKTKEYIGDSVYVEIDEYGGIVLTTENNNMKTIEEYRATKMSWQHKHDIDNIKQYLYTDNEIKQIQLDAIKEGMNIASDIGFNALHNKMTLKTRVEVRNCIRAEAEQLTEEDLK